jgi:hypothetical protein
MMIKFEDNLEPHPIFLLLRRGIDYYLNSWHEIDNKTGIFGSIDPQSFNMKSVGSSSPVIEYVIRPHLQILCVLASYLYKKETNILKPLLSEEKLVDILQKGLNWACETHLTGSIEVETFLERKKWGQNWRSSLWTSLLALCARLSYEYITPELIEKVKKVLEFEANRFIGVLPPSGYEKDTKIEENALDTMCMSWAIALCRESKNIELWKRTCAIWALNIASSQKDLADHSEYLEKSVSFYTKSQTLYPDMTAENHGFFHPEILCYSMWIVLSMAAFQMNNLPVPEFFRRKNHQETFELLFRFCLPTGMIYTPGGQDLPYFIPRPFALGWGIWNNDPRAISITTRLLNWMLEKLNNQNNLCSPWVLGFMPCYEGWELFFQSLVGFELALLAVLPFPKELRFYTTGQIENAVDTKRIFPYVEISYRRNVRMTRSVAWKAIGNHPIIGINIHNYPELIAINKANLLGIPITQEPIKQWEVVFHNDRYQKDGFDCYGRIYYYNAFGEKILKRDIRAITWGEDGVLVFDRIYAQKDIILLEQYLSPLYIVNDVWTGNRLEFLSGSLREIFHFNSKKTKEISCPSFWASIENCLLFQFIWAKTKGLVYISSPARNYPSYWKNCKLDTLAIHVDEQKAEAGNVVYEVGFFVGTGKSPRPFKCTGIAGDFFEGLIIMDGKNTIGLG